MGCTRTGTRSDVMRSATTEVTEEGHVTGQGPGMRRCAGATEVRKSPSIPLWERGRGSASRKCLLRTVAPILVSLVLGLVDHGGAVWAGEVKVQVQAWSDGRKDSVAVQRGAQGRTAGGQVRGPAPRRGWGADTGLRARVKALWQRNREVVADLRADVDSLNQRIEAGEASRAARRNGMNAIRQRRADARVGLDVLRFLHRVASDTTQDARWSDLTALQEAASTEPTILVMNRTGSRLAVDIWDKDSIRVSYVSIRSGPKGGVALPGAGQGLPLVRATMTRIDSLADGDPEGTDREDRQRRGEPALLVTVFPGQSERASQGQVGKKGGGDGTVVASLIVPRPGRLLLCGAAPVAVRNLEGIHVQEVSEDRMLALTRPAEAHVAAAPGSGQGTSHTRVRPDSSRQTAGEDADSSVVATPPDTALTGSEPGEPPSRPIPLSPSDSVLSQTLADLGDVSEKDSLRTIKRVIRKEPDCAEAYYLAAKIHISRNTPTERQSARRLLEKAVRVAPDSVRYRLALGDLLWRQGFRYNAQREFQKALRVDPGSAKAHLEIGRYFLKEYLRYREMGASDPRTARAGVGWQHWASEDLPRAVTYLETSLELDPAYREAYRELAVAYLEAGRPDTMKALFEQMLTQYPSDKEALLFSGLSSQMLGDHTLAYEQYSSAIERMGPEERALMESVDLISESDSVKAAARHAAGVMVDGSEWRDEDVLARFWREQDPLLLTRYNERRMDHYGRVAYANLRFARPEQGIPGWRTDMGMTHIRFGPPRHRMSRRPGIDPGLGGARIMPHLETWFYEGFSIFFQNWDGLDGWHFGTERVYGRGADKVASQVPSGRYVFKTMPQRYVDPYKHLKYTIPHQVAAFRDGDSVRVEVAYALPRENLAVSETDSTSRIESGLFLLDGDWNEEVASFEGFALHWQGSVSGDTPPADSLRARYKVFHAVLTTSPGQHHVVVEARDAVGGTIGTFREAREFAAMKPGFAMSDVLLASRIEPTKDLPEGRADLGVKANPMRTYHRSEYVFLYLETYGLALDGFGRSNYEISYRIGPPEKDEVDPGLFAAGEADEERPAVRIEAQVEEVAEEGFSARALREQAQEDDAEAQLGEPDHVAMDEPRRETVRYRVRYVIPERNRKRSKVEQMMKVNREVMTTVTARYEGDRADDFTYLQIDVAELPAGVYKLTVTARDALTKVGDEREVLFRVVE
jgi:GWxTD domain-containing protein